MTAKIDRSWQAVPTASVSRQFPFQIGRRGRLALGFPFVEQALLAQEFGEDVDTVLTYLAVSPPWVTRLLWAALRLGTGRLASQRADGLARILLRVPPIGGTSTRIVVSAQDDLGVCEWIRLETGEQGHATAAITVAVAMAVDLTDPAIVSTAADWVSLDDAIVVLKRTYASTSLTRSCVTKGSTGTTGLGIFRMGATH